ncbi:MULTISPECIES: apolipoprotein N-acyltransferase [unclassified Gilliamella]|uniref:apolipoprotein N-acyltransferase n=1 Tax=unclassified Gilliamella TaxID=2685620 RepID=UPI00132B2522|nr:MULTISPECIES: apolipoprotein N-acyltransferase [unclassified Gilliamella]MWN31351.1 apolipoprotein N-acyltransferase [Gilliamella sp. Pra-s60]MWP29041.1 apolipoprotein N-acyltransferase [Gilliamella sp. Pra-s54]
MLKPILLSLFLGSIAVFSYAPFHLWPLAFVSFAGLLWLIADKSKKQAVILGLSWGIGYFLAGVHWVYISIKQYGELPPFVAIIILGLLVLYLSLYPMLFAFLLRVTNRFATPFSFKQLVLVAPIVWQVTEFLRGYILTGFAWLQLGYSQLDSPLRAYFSVVGIDGVNLILTVLCGLLVYGIKTATAKIPKRHVFGAFIALVAIFFAPISFKNVDWTTVDNSRSANFALIQGNISQSIRWTREQLNNTLQTYAKLTLDNLEENKIIIWSEASITDYEINQQSFLQHLDNEARAHNAEIAVGIIDYRFGEDGYQSNGDIYNTLLVLGEKEPYQYPTINRYQKHHLVPFGEFTPLESVLEPIAELLNIPMSSMRSGQAKQPQLVIKGFKFTPAICYEIILSDLMRQKFTPDSDFLLTVSNDAWFGDSIGPKQHLQMAQARALEFGRPLIRSTNTGITAIIDQHGNIVKQLPQFKTDVLSTSVSPTTGLTPYARWGNVPYFVIMAFMLISLCIKRRS